MKTNNLIKFILFNLLFYTIIPLNSDNTLINLGPETNTFKIKTRKHPTKIQKKSYNDIQKEFAPQLDLSLKKNLELFKNYDYYANPGYLELISQAVGFEDFIFDFYTKAKSKKISKKHKKDGEKGGLKKHALIRYTNEKGEKIEKTRQETFNNIKNFLESNNTKFEQHKLTSSLNIIIAPKKTFTLNFSNQGLSESLDKNMVENEISTNTYNLLKEENINPEIFQKSKSNEAQLLITNELIKILNQTAELCDLLEIDDTINDLVKIICYIAQAAQQESQTSNYERSVDFCNLCYAMIEVVEQYINLFIDSSTNLTLNPEQLNYERPSLKIIENNALFIKSTKMPYKSFIIFSNYINACLNAAKALIKIIPITAVKQDFFQNVKQKNILLKDCEENLPLSQKIISNVAKLLFPNDESFQNFIEEATSQELVTTKFYSKHIGVSYINSTISNIFLETAKNIEENLNS